MVQYLQHNAMTTAEKRYLRADCSLRGHNWIIIDRHGSRAEFKCQHCDSVVSNGNFKRWHGNNCKSIDPTGHAMRTAQVASINRKD